MDLNDILKDINKSSDEYSEEDEFEDIPSTSTQNEEEKKEKTIVRASTKLTPQLKGLMGEANLRLARGDVETAQQMCFEVIRQLPNAWEPYLTLAQVYDNEPSKCKGYLTMASYLNPSNSSTWCRLAEICIEDGNIREAISFYSKCLAYDKKNLDVHMKRLELAEKLGDATMIIKYKQYLLTKLPEDRYKEIIELASEITKFYHENKKYAKALLILQEPFKMVPQHITPDLINMMLELLLQTNQYSQCLDIFVNFCNFNFEIVVEEDKSIHIKDYSMPEDISIDLKTKFIVCAVKLRCFDIVNKLIDDMLIMEDVEVVGDLFLDICEALMIEKRHDIALKLFIPLKKSRNYSLAGVWLKFSECLVACNLKEQAIEGYFSVITLAPQHIEVLHPLAELLLEMNKKQEALDVMSYQTTDRLNVGVLIMRLKLLKQIGDVKEYWKCSELLLSRHCAVFKNSSEVRAALIGGKLCDKIIRIQKLREIRNDKTEIILNQNLACVMEPSIENEYDLFKDMLQYALDNKEYDQLTKLVLMASTSKRFEKYIDEINYYVVLASLYRGDLHNGYHFARDAVVKYPQNNLIWNLLNMFSSYGDQRLNKFIPRFHLRMREHEACEIIVANSDFYFANFTSAMKYFIKEFKDSKAPYISFILGVITLHLSTIARQVSDDVKKQLSETSTYLFLYYSKFRSKFAVQEIYYNLGRMYHQLGTLHLAEHYYKKVLNSDNHFKKYSNILSLKREAAFNLHLIYINSGNSDAAANLLMKYIVV